MEAVANPTEVKCSKVAWENLEQGYRQHLISEQPEFLWNPGYIEQVSTGMIPSWRALTVGC